MAVIASTIGVIFIVLIAFAPFILIGLLVDRTRKNNARRRAADQERQARLIAEAMTNPDAGSLPRS